MLCQQHCYPPAYSTYSCKLLHNTQNSTEAVNVLSALVCLTLVSGATVLVLCSDRSDALIVKCEEMQVDGASRWKLTDVVGEEDGLGIECLSGSGAIAR